MEFNSGIVSYGLFINFKIDDLLLDLDLLLNISYDYHIIHTDQTQMESISNRQSIRTKLKPSECMSYHVMSWRKPWMGDISLWRG